MEIRQKCNSIDVLKTNHNYNDNYKIFKVLNKNLPVKSGDTDVCDTVNISKLSKNDTIACLNVLTGYKSNDDNSSSSKYEFNVFKESKITFKIKEKETFSYNKQTVLTACPAIANHKDLDLTQKNITINLPDWISLINLKEFFIYIKDENHSNFSISTKKLLLISDYFDNQALVSKLIRNEIIPYLNSDNCLMNLENSYLKLNMGQCKNKVWFDLFYESLNCSAVNFSFLIENNFEKIKAINKKVLEEMIEK